MLNRIANADYNTYLYCMNIHTQYIILGLFAAKRYTCDPVKGTVISLIGKTPNEIIPHLNVETGYLQLGLDLGFNKRLGTYVHHVMYLFEYRETFDPNFTIDHRDRNKLNNVPSNLLANTHSVNCHNKEKKYHYTGKKPRLPEQLKREMCTMYQNNATIKSIAKHFGCGRNNVYVILKNRLNVSFNRYSKDE